MNEKREGNGIMEWLNYRNSKGNSIGLVTYDGQWKNNKMNGLGKLEFSSTHYYSGMWVNNMMQGKVN